MTSIRTSGIISLILRGLSSNYPRALHVRTCDISTMTVRYLRNKRRILGSRSLATTLLQDTFSLNVKPARRERVENESVPKSIEGISVALTRLVTFHRSFLTLITGHDEATNEKDKPWPTSSRQFREILRQRYLRKKKNGIWVCNCNTLAERN